MDHKIEWEMITPDGESRLLHHGKNEVKSDDLNSLSANSRILFEIYLNQKNKAFLRFYGYTPLRLNFIKSDEVNQITFTDNKQCLLYLEQLENTTIDLYEEDEFVTFSFKKNIKESNSKHELSEKKRRIQWLNDNIEYEDLKKEEQKLSKKSSQKLYEDSISYKSDSQNIKDSISDFEKNSDEKKNVQSPLSEKNIYEEDEKNDIDLNKNDDLINEEENHSSKEVKSLSSQKSISNKISSSSKEKNEINKNEIPATLDYDKIVDNFLLSEGNQEDEEEEENEESEESENENEENENEEISEKEKEEKKENETNKKNHEKIKEENTKILGLKRKNDKNIIDKFYKEETKSKKSKTSSNIINSNVTIDNSLSNNNNNISIDNKTQKSNEIVQKCTICLDNLHEPATLKPCGHQFCKDCIEKWIKSSSACPDCKKNAKKISYFDKNKNKYVEKKVKKKKFKAEKQTYEDWFLNCDKACLICGKEDNTTYLLVCDCCNFRICHTYCVGLDAIPDDEWVCPECLAKQKGKKFSLSKTNLKKFQEKEQRILKVKQSAVKEKDVVQKKGKKKGKQIKNKKTKKNVENEKKKNLRKRKNKKIEKEEEEEKEEKEEEENEEEEEEEEEEDEEDEEEEEEKEEKEEDEEKEESEDEEEEEKEEAEDEEEENEEEEEEKEDEEEEAENEEENEEEEEEEEEEEKEEEKKKEVKKRRKKNVKKTKERKNIIKNEKISKNKTVRKKKEKSIATRLRKSSYSNRKRKRV